MTLSSIGRKSDKDIEPKVAMRKSLNGLESQEEGVEGDFNSLKG